MIALIDYGAGNLTSVRKALTAVGAQHFTPVSPLELPRAHGIIVPGVGNFEATAALDDGWRDAIVDVARRGVPLFGICLGMQWLFEGSDEAPAARGLGLISGRCSKLTGDERRHLKVPHVGWNSLEAPGRRAGASRMLASVPAGSQVYFTHSFAAPVTAECVAVTTHATRFAAVVERDLVFGVQFHPEKSSAAGLQILRNFLHVVEAHHRVS